MTDLAINCLIASVSTLVGALAALVIASVV